MPMRLVTNLPEHIETLMQRIIGCAIEVHRQRGPGFLERIYAEAFGYELEAHGIPFERERSIVVLYRGREIRGQRVDLIVAGAVIVEIKSVARLDPFFQAKLISYLRTTGCRAGLLINFNCGLVEGGVKANCPVNFLLAVSFLYRERRYVVSGFSRTATRQMTGTSITNGRS